MYASTLEEMHISEAEKRCFATKDNTISSEPQNDNCSTVYTPSSFVNSTRQFWEIASMDESIHMGDCSLNAYVDPTHVGLCRPSATHSESPKHIKLIGDPPRHLLGNCERAGIGRLAPRHMTSDFPGFVTAEDVESIIVPEAFELVESLQANATLTHNENKKSMARKPGQDLKKAASGSKHFLGIRCRGVSDCSRRDNINAKDFIDMYRIARPSGSKDRHSKVVTSRGPRDRRMRLSVETAIKFFHLQDRLGFDQPSKAVEWLIEKCKSAIDELPEISTSELYTNHSSRAEFAMNRGEYIGEVGATTTGCSADPSIAQRPRNRRKRYTSYKLTAFSADENCSHLEKEEPKAKQLKDKSSQTGKQGTKGRGSTRRGQAKCSPPMNESLGETIMLYENTGSGPSQQRGNEGLEAIGRRPLNMHADDPTCSLGGIQREASSAFLDYKRCLPPQTSASASASASGRDFGESTSKSFNFAQTQMEISPHTPVDCYACQHEGSSLPSTGWCADINLASFPMVSCPFPPLVPCITTNLQSPISNFKSILQ